MRLLLPISLATFLAARAIADVVAVPTPYEQIPVDKTVVWSPLFQATWDRMNETIGGKPENIDPPNETMSLLDATEWDANSVMPENAWKVWSGPANAPFLGGVNREAQPITGNPETFKLAGSPSGKAIVAFGLLSRDLKYAEPLYRSQKKPLDFKTTGQNLSCQFFGTSGNASSGFGNLIRVLSYSPSAKSHTLEIRCAGNSEGVVLYLPPEKLEKPETFLDACTKVHEWRSGFKFDPIKRGAEDDPVIHKDDDVRIPYLSFNHRQDFSSLRSSLRHYPGKPDPYQISQAEQITKFDLHEKGAKVEVVTSGMADPFGTPPPPPPMVPRPFVFDRPFFVFLWKDGAKWPYLGVWVGDTSSLKAFQ